MSDHPVKRKLSRDILPYVVTAKRLHRQWFYRLHLLFGYTTDFLVALTAIGISSPLFAFFISASESGENHKTELASITKEIGLLPPIVYYPIIILVLVWIILRVAFVRENGQKRAVLAMSCAQTFRQIEARLHRLLVKPEPMPDLTKLLDEEIFPAVDRNIQESAWPWTGPAPAKEINADLESLLADFCQKYESAWQIPVTPDLRGSRNGG